MKKIAGAGATESIRAGAAQVSSGAKETCSITGAGGQVNRADASYSIKGEGVTNSIAVAGAENEAVAA